MSEAAWKARWFRLTDENALARVLLDDCAAWLETFADESEDAQELAARVRSFLAQRYARAGEGEWRQVKVYDKPCTRCGKRMTYRHTAWETYNQNDTLIRLCNECHKRAEASP
jgi:hypothetical protein